MNKNWGLPPNPLGAESYHDWTISGLMFQKRKLLVILSEPLSGETSALLLSGTRFFLGYDILQGNIVSSVDCYLIGSENLDSVFEGFRGTSSEYYSDEIVRNLKRTQKFLGLKYLVVTPSYGAWMQVVCEDVVEISSQKISSVWGSLALLAGCS